MRRRLLLKTAKIYQFPLKGTKYQQWYGQAREVLISTNMTGARIWVTRNVPRQFRAFIIEHLRA